MLSPLAHKALLFGSLLASGCVGAQNFDDGEAEVRTGPKPEPTSDAGAAEPAAVPSETVGTPSATPTPSPQPGLTADGVIPKPATEPAVPVSSVSPSPEAMDAGVSIPETQPDVPSTPVGLDAGVPPAPPVLDAGVVVVPDAQAPAPSCEVDACNDHGACIEQLKWTLCDCDAAFLPECELPLFRELGQSRTSQELILTQISGDGSTVVGGHVPSQTPQAPMVAVAWTLDDGLMVLEQPPEGPTAALSVNFDGSIIRGRIEPPDGSDFIQVVWRNGVLGTPTADDIVLSPTARPTPSLSEVEAMLAAAGIETGYWDLYVVNDISDDGKVIFGLGLTGDYGARWLLRMP